MESTQNELHQIINDLFQDDNANMNFQDTSTQLQQQQQQQQAEDPQMSTSRASVKTRGMGKRRPAANKRKLAENVNEPNHQLHLHHPLHLPN